MQRMRRLGGITEELEHEFEEALAVGNGQGNLVCCILCSHKESDMTE